jgi:hypothetical protein
MGLCGKIISSFLIIETLLQVLELLRQTHNVWAQLIFFDFHQSRQNFNAFQFKKYNQGCVYYALSAILHAGVILCLPARSMQIIYIFW